MKKKLVRNLMYLYTSVFSSGIRNIVTQMFFDNHYPENKETLVSIALFFSALCTTAGIISSSKLNKGNVTKGRKILVSSGITLLVSLSFASMFLVHTFWAYTLLFGIASFGVNFMYNIFDVFISGNISQEERDDNIRILLSYQMAGYIIGPFFFSVFSSNPLGCIIFAILAQLAGYFMVGLEYIRASSDKEKGKFSAGEESPSQSVVTSVEKDVKESDKKALSFCFVMYFATEVLLPSIAYLLKDYLLVDSYELKTSLFLAVVVIAAALVIVFFSAKKSWKMQYVTPLTMGLALTLMMISRNNGIVFLIIIALVNGLGYGMFQSGSRYYVNSAEKERALVHRHNKIKTEATLIGYLASTFISWFCVRNGFPVVPAKMCLIILLYGIALIQAMALEKKSIFFLQIKG